MNRNRHLLSVATLGALLSTTAGEAGYRTGFAGKRDLNQRHLGWSSTHGPASHGLEWTADFPHPIPIG